MADNSRFIFSADPEFLNTALTELKIADQQIKLERLLAPGVGLIVSQLDELSFFTIVELAQPVFVRHLVPVQGELPLERDLIDIEKIVAAIIKLPALNLIKKKIAFTAQVRLLSVSPDEDASNTQTQKMGGTRSQIPAGRREDVEASLPLRPERFPYTPYAIKEKIVEAVMEKTDGLENIKAPRVVISVACAGDRAYFGISLASQNLSSWAGGERRYARVPGMISRAEFKLLEALETFGVTLPKHGTALDLGAAPGGWTRLLLEQGLRVVAVDPADLAPSLKNLPRLEHYRGHAEPYLEQAVSHNRIFDIVCNDMRMDARQAARLMLQAADLLSTGGLAITSLKLPHATSGMQPLKVMTEALEILQVGYEEVRARQLFHNRQEVTVCLRK